MKTHSFRCRIEGAYPDSYFYEPFFVKKDAITKPKPMYMKKDATNQKTDDWSNINPTPTPMTVIPPMAYAPLSCFFVVINLLLRVSFNIRVELILTHYIACARRVATGINRVVIQEVN